MNKEELETALAWALKEGVQFQNYDQPQLRDFGCGCCSGPPLNPPAELVGKIIAFALERGIA